MAITVPSVDKSGAYQKQATITTLSAVASTSPGYNQAQQALLQAQQELVRILLDNRNITPANVLSQVSYPSAKVPSALSSALTTWTTIVNTGGGAAVTAATKVDETQRAIVEELLVGVGGFAASVLSTMTYAGGAHQ